MVTNQLNNEDIKKVHAFKRITTLLENIVNNQREALMEGFLDEIQNVVYKKIDEEADKLEDILGID